MTRPKIEMNLNFGVKYLGNGIYDITAPMKEQIYLVIGKEKAMIIDTGMGIGSLKAIIDDITTLPLVVVNTHGHPDHAGGNKEFGPSYLNFKDLDVYHEMVTNEYRISDIHKIFGDKGKLFVDNLIDYSDDLLPYKDGDVFDLGERKIKAFEVEGHTKGSMVLYDENSKTLFVGDAMTIKETWLFLPCSTSLQHYYRALLNLKNLSLEVRRCQAGHFPNHMNYSLLDKKIKCVEKVINKKDMGKPFKTFAGEGRFVSYHGVSLVYNPNKIE